MLPDAPTLFSMITGWPIDSASCWPMMRATTSFAPPGAKPTITRMGLSGKFFAALSWACAMPNESAAVTKAAMRKSIGCFIFVSDYFETALSRASRLRYLTSRRRRRPDGQIDACPDGRVLHEEVAGDRGDREQGHRRSRGRSGQPRPDQPGGNQQAHQQGAGIEIERNAAGEQFVHRMLCCGISAGQR